MNYRILGILRDLKKKKPKFLKTSYLKSKFASWIFNIWFINYKKNFKLEETNRVLVVTLEAMGDNVVKTTSFKIMAEHYGKENFYIMCKDKWEEIFKTLGYNVLGYKNLKNPIKDVKNRIKFFKKVNSLNFKKVILFENLGNGGVLDNIICKDKIGICGSIENKHMKVIKIDTENSYVLDRHIELLNGLFGKRYSREELRPDMREMFNEKKYKDIITIGTGASTEEKTLPIKNMGEIVKMLSIRYPNKKLILLGNGRKQEEYARKLIKYCSCNNLESVIGKVSLLETIRLINDSDFFIGYDSGLSNVAFSLRKRYICLFWTDMTIWQHPFNDLVILKGDGKNPENDGYHGTDILNSIKVSQVIEALNYLKL